MPGQQENEGTAGQNSPWFAFYLVISRIQPWWISFTSDGCNQGWWRWHDEDKSEVWLYLTAFVQSSLPLQQCWVKTRGFKPLSHIWNLGRLLSVSERGCFKFSASSILDKVTVYFLQMKWVKGLSHMCLRTCGLYIEWTGQQSWTPSF